MFNTVVNKNYLYHLDDKMEDRVKMEGCNVWNLFVDCHIRCSTSSSQTVKNFIGYICGGK